MSPRHANNLVRRRLFGLLALLAMLTPVFKAGVATAMMMGDEHGDTPVGHCAHHHDRAEQAASDSHAATDAHAEAHNQSSEHAEHESHGSCCGSDDCQCAWSCVGCGFVPVVFHKQAASPLDDRFRSIAMPTKLVGPATGYSGQLYRPPA